MDVETDIVLYSLVINKKNVTKKLKSKNHIFFWLHPLASHRYEKGQFINVFLDFFLNILKIF